MGKALIVIDMQNDFINGSLGTPEAQAILPTVKKLIEDGDYHRLIFTRDTHDENYLDTPEGKALPVKHCIKGTNGWNIHDDLDISRGDNIINKPTFGYMYWNATLALLGDIDEVDIIGLCTDICVITNALIIKTECPDIKVNIIADATAGTTPEAKAHALAVAKSCQVNVI